jgi:hypothetical protein
MASNQYPAAPGPYLSFNTIRDAVSQISFKDPNQLIYIITEKSYYRWDFVLNKYTKASTGPIVEAFEPTITAGIISQYWRGDKTWQNLSVAVLAVTLTGLNTSSATPITSSNNILVAFGLLQGQINSITSSSLTSPLTSKGDIWVWGSSNTRLPVGTGGQFLVVDLSQTTGLKWKALISGDITTALGYTPYNSTNPSGYISGNQTITLSGDVTGSGTTSIITSIASTIVTGKLLTGYTIGSDTPIASTDSILNAFGNLQGEINNRVTKLLTSAHIFVGNGSNVATDVAVSGDLTLTNTGAFTVVKINGASIPTIGSPNYTLTVNNAGTGLIYVHTLQDSTNKNSINYFNRTSIDTSGSVTSIDWGSRVLFDSLGNNTVNWDTYILSDSSSGNSIDWGNRLLYGSALVTSIDWANRLMLDNLSATQLAWNTTGVSIPLPGAATFKVAASAFIIDSNGNITSIHNVVTSFPSAQGSANTFLKNNGSGVLTWSDVILIGDVTGSYLSNTVAKINGVTLGSTAATAGNLLIGSGSQWVSTVVSGDITITSGGVTAIGANKVTYAKFQTVAASSLIGNPTGSSATAQAITLGATLSFVSTALQTLAITGDVTASANSFSTTVTKINGVTLGSTTATAGNLLIGSGSQWVSVAVSGDITINSSGVTTIGTNLVTYAKFQQVAASSLVGNPTGTLANAQGITLGSTLTFISSSLQTLAITGDVTASANSFSTTVVKINGATVPTIGTANQLLGVNNGASGLEYKTLGLGTTGTDISWALTGANAITLNVPTASATNRGALSSADWSAFNTVISAPTSVLFGSSPNTNGGAISGNILTLQPADGTRPGGVSITTQTFGGAKTFSSQTTLLSGIINDTGGNGYLEYQTQLSDVSASAVNLAVRVFTDSNGDWAFVKKKIASSDTFVRRFVSTLTANRNYTLPDVAGTFVLGTGSNGQIGYWNANNTQTGDANFTWDTTNGLTVGKPITNSYSNALSKSAILMTGSPIVTGGTGSTTYPLFFMLDGPISTRWGTTGTYIGVNANATFTGNLIDLQLFVSGGASKFSVDYQGNTSITGLYIISNSYQFGHLPTNGGMGIQPISTNRSFVISTATGDTTRTDHGAFIGLGSNVINTDGTEFMSIQIFAGARTSGTQGQIYMQADQRIGAAITIGNAALGRYIGLGTDITTQAAARLHIYGDVSDTNNLLFGRGLRAAAFNLTMSDALNLNPANFTGHSFGSVTFKGTNGQNGVADIQNVYFAAPIQGTNITGSPNLWAGRFGGNVRIDGYLKITTSALLGTTIGGAIENDGTHLYYTPVAAGTRYKLDQQGISNYAHTITAPVTAATVNLVNNQYNIINPAGTLATLTINFPSSPSNNDVVLIKFTQAVTVLTYSGGTVADQITAPSLGGLLTYVYDSGASTWY